LKPTAAKELVSDRSFVSQDQELVELHGGSGLFVDLLDPLGAMLRGWPRFVGFPHDLFAIVMVRDQVWRDARSDSGMGDN
jgi:hypothetical protein